VDTVACNAAGVLKKPRRQAARVKQLPPVLMVIEALCFPDQEAVPVQPKLSPVVWHHPDDDFLVLGEDCAAPVAPRLPVAGAFSEIRRLAAWKATISSRRS